MGDKEKYLDRLEKAKDKSSFRDVREKYKSVSKQFMGKSVEEGYRSVKSVLEGKSKFENEATASAVAYNLLNAGIEKGDLAYVLTGAKMYEKLGRGAKVIPRLLKGIEAAASKGDMGERYYKEAKEFIKRNTEEKKGGGLEGRMSIFLLFFIGGIILSFASFSITGNAVSNLTGTTQGLSGLILIIVGLTGLFFSFRK